MGRAVTASFLADGFTVFGADLAPPPPAERLLPVALDVRDHAALHALAARAAAETDLRVWVNYAGVVSTAAIEEASPEEWDRILGINLTGTFNGCAAAFAVMREASPP